MCLYQSGPGLVVEHVELVLEVPTISTKLVAYMEGQAEPLRDGSFDSRAKGVMKAAAKEALKNLNKLANEPYMA
jgi:hypothetical protein